MHTDALAPGTVVGGRFRLESRLGSGGFGTVWRATDEELREVVALKILNPDIARNDDARERFLQEVKATRSFVHKYAVQPRDFGRDATRGLLYFTMGLVEGPTLRHVLAAAPGGRLDASRALRIATQVLEVLEEAHAAGLVHRDLKPENLILTRARDGAEEARVLDFGIAKAISASSEKAGLTATGTMIGTLSYMSPEQAAGTKVDGRSDLYAVAVILYECLAGRRPIEPDPEADDPNRSLLWNLAMKPPRPLGELAAVTPALEAAVARALAKKPDERFASAHELHAALAASGDAHATLSGQPTGSGPAARTLTGLPTGAAPASETPRPKRSPLVALAAAAVLVAALGGAAAYSWRGETPREPTPAAPPRPLPEPAPPPVARAEDPPALEVDAPAEGAITSAAVTTISGRATSASGLAAVLVNGASASLLADGRFTATAPLATEGESTIEVVARDRAGREARRPVRRVRDTERPTIELRRAGRPMGEAEVVATAELAFEVVVADAHPRATILVNGRAVPWPAAPARETVALVEGDNQLTVSATDAAGNETTRSVRVALDTKPPRLELTAPPGGAAKETRSRSVSIAGKVSDEHAVVVTIDGTPVALAGSEFQATRELDAEGERRFKVVATDAAGNATSADAVFVLRTKGPFVKLDDFAERELVSETAELLVQGSVDERASEVVVLVGDKPGGKGRVGGDGRFSARVPLSIGLNDVRARARDALGNESETAAQTIRFVQRVKVGRVVAPPQRGFNFVVVRKNDGAATPAANDALFVYRGGARLGLSVIRALDEKGGVSLQTAPESPATPASFNEGDEVWREVRTPPR